MFDSAKNDTRVLVKEQTEAVVWLLLFVLTFSFMYYFSFFLAEVAPSFVTWWLHTFRRCTRQNVREQELVVDENIQLMDNPFYATSKRPVVDQRELQNMMAESLSVLERAEQENKMLRDDLKRRKVEAQVNETKNMKGANVDDSQDRQYKRKEFAAARLTTHLTNNKSRARGGRGGAEVEDNGEGDE
jgi:hypothetical protein